MRQGRKENLLFHHPEKMKKAEPSAIRKPKAGHVKVGVWVNGKKAVRIARGRDRRR